MIFIMTMGPGVRHSMQLWLNIAVRAHLVKNSRAVFQNYITSVLHDLCQTLHTQLPEYTQYEKARSEFEYAVSVHGEG